MISCVGGACTGCLACKSICPKGCISIEKRELGHVYPLVDGSKCIECGKCLKVCHAFRPREVKPFSGEAYALQAKDWRLLANSSSGAAFSLIAEDVIARGGIVYGSAWEGNSGARHIRVDRKEGLGSLRRSKYVQSGTDGIYERVKQDLSTGAPVLYSGVPCQIAALQGYLGDAPDNLLTVDLICHGVPSAELYEEYLKWVESDRGSRVVEYRSRDKEIAGWSCLGSMKIQKAHSGKERWKILPQDDPYLLLFNSGADFRDSCYECRYSNGDRVADITIGDFWGVEPLGLPIDICKGVSAVLANTDKGFDLVESLSDRAHLYKVDFSDVARKNANLNAPTVKPEFRETVAKLYEWGGVAAIVPFIRKRCYRQVLKNQIKRLVPTKMKALIKSSIRRRG